MKLKTQMNIFGHPNVFWQYPNITEKVMSEKHNSVSYLGIPWATLIDKKILTVLSRYKHVLIDKKETCCQHVSFRKIIPICKKIGITKLYTPHKIIGEDVIQGVEIISCPIYAVNFEDDTYNKEFKDSDFLNIERKLLYSFKGGWNNSYMSDIRPRIVNMKHPENTCVESIGGWHFENVVYNNKQNKQNVLNINDADKKRTTDYNKLLLNSRFSLCPSGSGPNSVRFWESLACGSIPVLLSDKLDLPKHDLWNKTIVRVKESELEKVPELLSQIDDEDKRRKNCLQIYEDLKIVKTESDTKYKEIIHYCCGKYPNVGGVARFDLQLSLIFPDRVFFEGPRQKNKMLKYLSRCINPVVITDNHLSCDIPNNYDVILVHHGCARTHVEREPGWGEPWKSLCTNGQNKMLTYREPPKTKIVSISQSCSDDFIKYYGEKYTKFDRVKILHTSELDEDRYKTSFNQKPVVLGNWSTLNKGRELIPKLKSKLKEYKFNQLNVQPRSDYKEFNKRKQDIYLKSDIFLQISNSEGNSYATLDALICGLIVVASDVGLFYGDVPDDCFVKLEWERNGDVEYVRQRLEYAWEHRDELSKNARKWYMENCRFCDWESKFKDIINYS